MPRVALCLLAAACGSSTEPSVDEVGRYVAAAVGERPLPAPIDPSAPELGVLIADTLELDGRGVARLASAVRRASWTSGTDTVYFAAVDFAYRRLGPRTVEIRCPPNASCVGTTTGTLTARGIVLTGTRYGAATVVFARVAP